MRRIVQRQIVGEDPSFCFHTIIEGGSRVGSQDMRSDGFNLVFYDPVQC